MCRLANVVEIFKKTSETIKRMEWFDYFVTNRLFLVELRFKFMIEILMLIDNFLA